MISNCEFHRLNLSADFADLSFVAPAKKDFHRKNHFFTTPEGMPSAEEHEAHEGIK